MTETDLLRPLPKPPLRRDWLLGAGALLIALVLLIASALALNLNLSVQDDNRALVFRTNTILRALAELQSSLHAAETGQRGYILTGEERYLAPYREAIGLVEANFDELRGLIRHPAQVERLRALPPLIQAKLDELAETVALREQSFEAALAVVRTDVGQALMEELGTALNALREAERRLLEERVAQEERSVAVTARIAWLEGFLALVCAVIGMVWFARQRAHARLVASERRFRELAENIQEVFWMADPRQGRILYVNPAFETIWGRPRASLYRNAHAGLEAVHPEDRARVEAAFFGGGVEKSYAETYRLVRPDGSVRWIRDRGWPVRNEAGNVQYLVGVAEDVTEIIAAQEVLRRTNEELERRVEQRTAELTEVNRELDAFAYTISHDLRAPLRAMHGFADALIEDYGAALPQEGRQYAKRITAAAVRMEDLIEDILTYSRLSREAVSLRPVPLDSIIAQVVANAAPQIEQAGASIEIGHPLPEVLAHPPTLVQAIDNLLSNAIKFVPPGAKPQVRIEAERRDGRVRLFVEDNGIGVSAEHHERIFQPFERLHGVESYPGTGVGLGIVRKSMERMGGSYGVASRPGAGSRFWIELPSAQEGGA